MHKLLILCASSWLIAVMACNTPYAPKATGYPAIRLPQKNYESNKVNGLPYTFELPTYAVVDRKVTYFGVDKENAGWMNLQFPAMNATVYISYNRIQQNNLEVLVRDAYNFANNHSNKASFIEDSSFVNPKGLKGVFFHLGGDVASPYQFFITDSSKHFLRGALYFDTTPNADSLAPVIDFLFQDLKHLVNTFQWKS